MLAWGLSRLLPMKLTLPFLATGGLGLALISAYSAGTLNARGQCRAALAIEQSRQELAHVTQSAKQKQAANAHAAAALQRLQPKRDRLIARRERAINSYPKKNEKQDTDRYPHIQTYTPDNIILDESDIIRLYIAYEKTFSG